MTFYAALLVVIGVAAALFGGCTLLVWLEKKVPPKQFDERQQIARGKAYKWAWLTGLCYFLVIAFADLVLPSGVQVDLFLLIMIGLTLEAFVCECYCCLHDAYLPLTRSPKANIIMLYVMTGIYLLNAVNWVDRMAVTIEEGRFIKRNFGEVMLGVTGDSAFVWGFLMVGAMSFVIATMELVRYFRSKSE